ncbi:MAG: hypothetical protein PHG24_00900 [Candidatus Pacebacteria bacterium]|nr:hypothetical protein [Candidatus Paceibacterota bacterium]
MSLDLYSKEETPTWKKILFIFSIVLAFIVLVIFSYNQFSKIPQKSAKITSINIELAKQGTEEQQVQREFVLEAESKLNEFKQIYDQKVNFDKFFNEFGSWVYPRVSFLSLTIDVASSKLTIEGQTDTLQSVMQQLILLDAKNNILSYTISNIEIGENGLVSFNLELNINPELFKKDEQQ